MFNFAITNGSRYFLLVKITLYTVLAEVWLEYETVWNQKYEIIFVFFAEVWLEYETVRCKKYEIIFAFFFPNEVIQAKCSLAQPGAQAVRGWRCCLGCSLDVSLDKLALPIRAHLKYPTSFLLNELMVNWSSFPASVNSTCYPFWHHFSCIPSYGGPIFRSTPIPMQASVSSIYTCTLQ